MFDVTRSADRPPNPAEGRRWPLVIGVLLAVILIVVAVAWFAWSKLDTNRPSARPDWQPPPQTFLSSPMNVQPSPGWRTDVTDLGLPAQSRYATTEEPYRSQPLIGYVGDSAYFLVRSTTSTGVEWRLVGLDVRDGRVLFPPVPLSGGARAPTCLLNGPGSVLCVGDDAANPTAWVIDTQTGAVPFTGPTEIRSQPGTLGIKQVGMYAVAETIDEGVHGVGPTANTTWFVPGDGSVAQRLIPNTDVEPPTLAAQATGGRGSDRMVVFSVVDGSVVTPELSEGSRPLSAVVYPDGFAVEVARDEPASAPDGIEFFDPAGKRLGHAETSGFLSTMSMDVPIGGTAVFSRSGERVAEISGFEPGDLAILVGTRLLTDTPPSDTVPQQYDLRTGAELKSCDVNLGGYLATDGGAVAVFEDGNPNIGLLTEAVDLTTCDTLWTLSSPVGSFRDVWRVNTTLVQLSDDGTELMSLVAPK